MENDDLHFLHLSDGEREVLYPVQKVKDAATIEGDLTSADDDPFIEALGLVEGRSIGLIDANAMFDDCSSNTRSKLATQKSASAQSAPAQSASAQSAIICSLPDTHWARSILAPLIGDSGYQIVYGSQEADIAITLDADDADDGAIDSNAAIIRLRSMPDDLASDEEKERSIYRYDRTAVLSALSTHKNMGGRA